MHYLHSKSQHHLARQSSLVWTGWSARVAAGGLVGMVLGQAISHRIAGALLQKGFAVGLLLTAVAMVTSLLL